jgi:hypothetical protein
LDRADVHHCGGAQAMSSNYFGLIEEGITAAIVIGFCVWELYQLRKIKDKNRKK